MSRILLLNVEDPEEHRAALVESGRLSLLWVERADERSLVGNVYKGRVVNVEPAFGACFVDIGTGRPAFLHADDMVDGERGPPGGDPEIGAGIDDRNGVGTDGAGDTVATSPVEVAAAAGGDPAGNSDGADPWPPEPPAPPPRIDELVTRGQEIVIQIVRDAIGTKGPTATTRLALAARTLVLMPRLGRVGVSRKITDPVVREEIRARVAALPIPAGMGVVARTAARAADPAELGAELEELVEAHDQLIEAGDGIEAPALLYEEKDFVTRAIRDLGGRALDGPPGPTRIVVDTEAGESRARAAIDRGGDGMEVVRHGTAVPLFHSFSVEEEVRSLQRPRVPLPGGAHLVIQPTEALWAIDVNSGRYREGGRLEETALGTDLMAARECARQIRLRDLSGLIMVDFIDCRDPANRDQVEAAFRAELSKDPARTRAESMSEFMVMEVTRRRLRAGPVLSGTDVCPSCRGLGRVVNPAQAALSAVRDLRALVAESSPATVEIRCDRRTAGALDAHRERIDGLAAEKGVTVSIRISTGERQTLAEVRAL